MKKTILLIILSFNFCVAQDLYVDTGSYLYARDICLFVNDEIQLEDGTSHLYLRGDAQLLQNSDTKNRDNGFLSVYQDITKEIYEYHYWCSPVGEVAEAGAVGSQGNRTFDTRTIYRPDDPTDLTDVGSSLHLFIPGFDATETELSSYWIYMLQDAEGYSGWTQVGTNTGMVDAGYGFTMKGRPDPPPVDPKTIDFRGRPNNGNITVSVNYDGVDNEPTSEPDNQAATLTGNPYPSSLDIKLLFVDPATLIPRNTNIDGLVFFWEQAAVGSHLITAYQGGYATYAPGDLGDLNDNGTYAVAVFETYNGVGGDNNDNNGTSPDFTPNSSRRYAAIGQGFLLTSSNPGSVVFDNSMRLYLAQDSNPGGTGAVFRSSEQSEPVMALSSNGVDYQSIINTPTIIPEIRIHSHINDTYYRESVLAFRSESNLSYNKYMDAEMVSVLNDDTFFVADSKNLVIQSIDYNPQIRVPFGIKSGQDGSKFSISVNSLRGVDEDVNIYMYDDLYGTYTDIKNGAFEITLDEAVYSDRFEITFENQDTLSDLDDLQFDFKIFQDNGNQQLTILNPNAIEVLELRLFDMAGKQVIKNNELDIRPEYHFSTAGLSEGVYVASVSVGDGDSIQKKIIIKN